MPGAPSGSSSGLALVCGPSTALAGELVVCTAVAGLANVNHSTIWTSSDPNVARPEGFGLFTGKSEGQATVTATYSGRSVSVRLTVHLQDVLRATASAGGGTFKVGTSATLWLQGFYGVASADSGTLALVVTDQSGATISTSPPLTVPHGGDSYLISASFIPPPGTTRVCRTGVLQIGLTTLTVVPETSLQPCVEVAP